MQGKKTAALLLPFALSAYVSVANASITTNGGTLDNKDGDQASTTTVTADALSALRRDVNIQASGGVLLEVDDENDDAIDANEVGIAGCHDSGNTEYYATSAGGGVLQGGSITTCNSDNLDFSS